MRPSRIRERVAEYLRRKDGVALCAGCIARTLAADEGRVRYTLVLLEGSRRFPRRNGRCAECGQARLVSCFADGTTAAEPPRDAPAEDLPDTPAAEPAPEAPLDAEVPPRPKCARCSFVIGAAERSIVENGDAFHDYCWQILTSSRSIADSRRLTRDSRARVAESRGRAQAPPLPRY